MKFSYQPRPNLVERLFHQGLGPYVILLFGFLSVYHLLVVGFWAWNFIRFKLTYKSRHYYLFYLIHINHIKPYSILTISSGGVMGVQYIGMVCMLSNGLSRLMGSGLPIWMLLSMQQRYVYRIFFSLIEKVNGVPIFSWTNYL